MCPNNGHRYISERTENIKYYNRSNAGNAIIQVYGDGVSR